MTSSPLKASHIKTGVKKKVKAAKRYTLRHADLQDDCMAPSPYEHTLIEIRIRYTLNKTEKLIKQIQKKSVYVQFRVAYFKRPATHLDDTRLQKNGYGNLLALVRSLLARSRSN